eukprot:1967794-Alexandrium_andersonii.AAC.1
MRQTSTPAAPRYWAPPRRSACPPQRGSENRPERGQPRRVAPLRMVSMAACFCAGAPEEFGNSGTAA